MVQLFNIMSDGKYISCDYIPEQSGESEIGRASCRERVSDLV